MITPYSQVIIGVRLLHATGVSIADLKAVNPRAAARASGWLIQGERLFIPAATRMLITTHVVQVGESWSVIAKQYGLSTQLLKAANPQSIRYNEVLYRGETLFVPVIDGDTADAIQEAGDELDEEDSSIADSSEDNTDTSDADGTTTTQMEADNDESTAGDTTTRTNKTEEVAGAESTDATPTPVAEDAAGTTAETASDETETQTSDDDPALEASAEALACPATMADTPMLAIELLSATNGDADALATYLMTCDASMQNTIVNQDLTGDGIDDFVIVYGDPEAVNTEGEQVIQRMDLLILNSGEASYTTGYQARAESQVQLLSTVDVNSDGQSDVVWTETTCGVTDCFLTIQVYRWDGKSWRSWTAEKVTLANAEVRLEDVDDRGQGFELLLDGGVYANADAGPQRSRSEVWASIDGAPYSLLTTDVGESDCLYHLVLDANVAFTDGATDDLAASETLYTKAISDESFVACGSRENEVDELRSFSTYRLALIGAYRGQPQVAGDLIATLSETFPDSIYDRLGTIWLDAYQETYDVAAGCAAVEQFAMENPEATAILADYGYANPDFTVAEICPLLDIAIPTPIVPTATPEPTIEPASEPTASPAEEVDAETTDAAENDEVPAEVALSADGSAEEANGEDATATEATTANDGGLPNCRIHWLVMPIHWWQCSVWQRATP